MKSQALLVTDIRKIELGEIELPEPEGREILVETAYSCVSPGTELRGIIGQQAGFEGHPYIPGYAMSGTVIEAGPDSHLKPGDRIFCNGTMKADKYLMWGGHTRHALLDAHGAFKLPDNVSLQDACITKLAAIARRGVRVGQAKEGETVGIIGLGPIGQLSARLHQLTGARVVAADLAPSRVERLTKLGIEAGVPEGSLEDYFAAKCPEGVKMVVDATGSPAVLEHSLNVAHVKEWNDPEPGSRVLIQGSYPDTFTVDYDACFRHEIALLFPRDNTASDMEQVLGFMSEGKLDVSDLVADVRDPADCQALYDTLLNDKDALLTAVFQWK